MKKDINWFIKKGQIVQDDSFKHLSRKFLEKSRNNLITMNLLSELNENKKARSLLRIPNNYSSDEWVVITGYYAMYASALALLAKIGFKSKNHTATVLILDEFFIKKKFLTREHLHLLENASFKKEEIEELSEARQKREIAQYSVTKQTTKEIAEKIKKDAYEFVDKCEETLTQIEQIEK